MPVLAGDIVTATTLNHLKPTTYQATGDTTLTGAVTTTAISGATITVTTETDDAVFNATSVVDYDLTGATTTICQTWLYVDGVQWPGPSIFQQGVSTDRLTVGQIHRGVCGAAGSHTFDLRATLPANAQIAGSGQTKLTLMIFEVV